MTFTNRTDGRSQRKELAMKLLLAIGEAVGLAFGMAATRTAELK
ncbi:MAG TPA: hypothetical protein VHF45_01500 [Thermoleophilaceae bacterium]|nr:hypothetical protein [Thermoleophilaceae bacterium]